MNDFTTLSIASLCGIFKLLTQANIASPHETLGVSKLDDTLFCNSVSMFNFNTWFLPKLPLCDNSFKVQFVYPCLQLCVSLIKLNITQKLSDVNN